MNEFSLFLRLINYFFYIQILADSSKNSSNKNSERQIDRDAKWSGAKNKFGYKNHIKVDKTNKFIVEYAVSSANCYDTNSIDKLVNSDDFVEEMMMDKACDSKENINKFDFYDFEILVFRACPIYHLCLYRLKKKLSATASSQQFPFLLML